MIMKGVGAHIFHRPQFRWPECSFRGQRAGYRDLGTRALWKNNDFKGRIVKRGSVSKGALLRSDLVL
jgi:hypothetical protein